ncbi:MAG: FAD-binding protein, partial [Chloroflexota bacterium]
RDYYLERQYPAYGNLVPRDVASRAAKRQVDNGRGVGPLKNGVYLDFGSAIDRLGQPEIEERYGNLFEMYDRITGEDPYETPMRIYPATHYTMGGLWVDYNLMSSIPGLFVGGEANFSDHGANRLGASALMQGLADGYFVLPNTVSDYLAGLLGQGAVGTDHAAFRESRAEVEDQTKRYLSNQGTHSVDYFHKALGHIVWEKIGMERTATGLQEAMRDISSLREDFRRDVRVLGSGESLNDSLEKAGRVADFFDLAELIARDGLHREESCGGHFRVEHQTEDGEAARDDENFSYVAAWEWQGEGKPQLLNKEPLEFEHVHPAQRSYK